MSNSLQIRCVQRWRRQGSPALLLSVLHLRRSRRMKSTHRLRGYFHIVAYSNRYRLNTPLLILNAVYIIFLLPQGTLPAGLRRPVAHRAGFPSPRPSQQQQQQQGYGEMASLVASRYGERYASAPALSSGTLNAATPSYNTRSLHNNNRLGSNVQIGINHFNTIGGHRRYHTPVGSSSAELSIFSSGK